MEKRIAAAKRAKPNRFLLIAVIIAHGWRGRLKPLTTVGTEAHRVGHCVSRELETLGLDDLRSEISVLLIEWGEKFPQLQREREVEISLERDGDSGRRIRIVT